MTSLLTSLPLICFAQPAAVYSLAFRSMCSATRFGLADFPYTNTGC